jgi:hypothetical protein
VIVCATVGLAGTGAMIALSQEKKADPAAEPPAPASRPAAATSLAPAKDWTIAGPAFHVPSVFPEIKPADLRDLAKSCPLMSRDSVEIREADPVELKLLKAKLNLLLGELALERYRLAAGPGSSDDVMRIVREITRLVPLIFDRDSGLTSWLQEYVSVAKAYETVMEHRFEAGTALQTQLIQARRARLDAELDLHKQSPKAGKN